jgi:hypothetical protein
VRDGVIAKDEAGIKALDKEQFEKWLKYPVKTQENFTHTTTVKNGKTTTITETSNQPVSPKSKNGQS